MSIIHIIRRKCDFHSLMQNLKKKIYTNTSWKKVTIIWSMYNIHIYLTNPAGGKYMVYNFYLCI